MNILRPREDIGRKHPVHRPVCQTDNRVANVFVTVNTNQRKAILAKPDTAQTIFNAWKEAYTWLVGRYVIMPDHVHLFCAPNDLTVSLKRWIKFWKSLSQTVGRALKSSPFGNWTFGILSCDRERVTAGNEIASGEIPFGKGLCQSLMIGLMRKK